jgi:hypothetical protein
MTDPESLARQVIERSKFYDVFKKQYFEQAVDDAYDRGQIISQDIDEIHFADSSFLIVNEDGVIIDDVKIEFGTFI